MPTKSVLNGLHVWARGKGRKKRKMPSLERICRGIIRCYYTMKFRIALMEKICSVLYHRSNWDLPSITSRIQN